VFQLRRARRRHGDLLASTAGNFVVEEERPFLSPGESCGVVETPLGRLGLLAGYDIHFPEVSRASSPRGEVLVYCAQLLRPFAQSIRLIGAVTAAENSCYLLLASATGGTRLAALTLMGGSLILQSGWASAPTATSCGAGAGPREAGIEEGMLTAEIAIATQRRLHAVNPPLPTSAPAVSRAATQEMTN